MKCPHGEDCFNCPELDCIASADTLAPAKVVRTATEQKRYDARKAWRKRNPEKVREASRRYYRKHREESIARNRRYYLEHAEEINEKNKKRRLTAKQKKHRAEYMKAYYDAHREELKAKQKVYNKRRREAMAHDRSDDTV